MKTFTVSAIEKGLLLFVLLSLLFNGAALYKAATLTEHGARQDRLTALALPVRMASERTGACGLRNAVAGTVGVWLNKKENKE